MKTTTSFISKQVRYQQWADDFHDCNARPDGMTVETWCKNHGINPNTYYWRLNALRRACIEIIPGMARVSETAPAAVPRFVDINAIARKNLEKQSPQPVIIRLGNSLIELNEGISDAFLLRVMEAAAHVQ